MSRARHARRTPTKALIAVGAAILAGMAFVMPDVLATEGTDHESSGQHTLAVTKLPKLDGHPTHAEAINDHGVIVGHAKGENEDDRAVVWEGGELRVLDNLPGGNSARARDINNQGEIVGQARTEHGQYHAVLWEPDGTIRDLGTLEDAGNSIANAINDAGQVVGSSANGPGDFRSRAFLWENGEMRRLDVPGEDSIAVDIANSGDIVGYYDGEDRVEHAFLLRDGEAHTLARRTSRAFAVSDSGHVAGELEWLYTAPQRVATLWLDGLGEQAVDLRGTPDGRESAVFGINKAGDMVGTIGPESKSAFNPGQAVLWPHEDRTPVHLSPVSGHDATQAADINNHGVIVGSSTGGDGTDPVIWK